MPTDLVTQFTDYCTEAATAIAEGDYATALNKARAAQALAAAIPSLSRSAGSGGGSQSAQWSAEAVDRLIGRIQQALSSSQGVTFTNVVPARLGASDSDQLGIF